MDDAYFEAEEKQDEKTQVKEELREALLEAAYIEIAQLKRTNEELQKGVIETRDQIALHCFVSIYEKSGDPKQSAMDAYRMADAFLRVRETGGIEDDKPNQE
jgi:hypothetical protein